MHAVNRWPQLVKIVAVENHTTDRRGCSEGFWMGKRRAAIEVL